MKYARIVKSIAKKHGISKREVDMQMRKALKESGINFSPEVIIEIATQQIKDYLS
ncbi:MAG: hypothetical protein IKZ47_07120 [Clostridia bacterium]|nr:hypothetical protein [Clostridia bacterium]